MEPRYTLLDHPADIGIEARGTTLAEAFISAAAGLISVIIDRSTVQILEWRDLTISSGDIEQLCVKWLSELLYLYDGQGFVASEFDITAISPSGLTARIGGEKFSAEHHRTNRDVKAVTYHQISVGNETGDVVIRVYLDI